MNPEDVKPEIASPVMDVQRPRQVVQPTTALPDATGPDQVPTGQPQPQPQPPKRRIALIVTLVIIGLVLIGVVVAFVLISQKDQTPATSDQTASEATRVTTDEIDATVSEIDKTLNTLNDSADFTTGDINNDALGL